MVLPYIDMNPPWVYMRSQTWTILIFVGIYFLFLLYKYIVDMVDHKHILKFIWYCQRVLVFLPAMFGSSSLSTSLTVFGMFSLFHFCHASDMAWHGSSYFHFSGALQCAKSLQSCRTLCDLIDWSPPGSTVHGIFPTRIREWVAVPSSRGSSRPRDWAVSSDRSPALAGGFFTTNYHHLGSPVNDHKRKSKSVSRSVIYNSLQPHGL